jgi:hypothetical protein
LILKESAREMRETDEKEEILKFFFYFRVFRVFRGLILFKKRAFPQSSP